MNLNRSRHAGLLLLAAASVSSHAQQYVELAAEIQLATYRSGDTNAALHAKPVVIAVTCITSTNEWRIDHDFIKGGLNCWFYDGTNVYNGIVPADPAERRIGISIWPSIDGCPLGDPAANIIWLAFCSGVYLKRPDRLVPLPLNLLRHAPDRFGYTDRTVRFADEFGLPQTLDLFSSRTLLERSSEEFHQEHFSEGRYVEADKKTAATSPEGKRTFHYAVNQTTNFQGWTFPVRFEFYQEGRPYLQNGDWYRRGIGTVRSIRTASKPRGLFDPSRQQTIIDWRFRDLSDRVDAIIYASTNGYAQPTNSPDLQRRFQETRQRMAHPGPTGP